MTFECLGRVASGVTDLYWIILRDGMEPLIAEIDTEDSYMITLGDNYITLNILNSNSPFRGAVRCISETSSDKLNVFIQPGKSVN